MADNTTLDTMSGGDVIATDDIGGVKYQRVKVTFGADGTANDVESTSTNPLPVTTGAPATGATELAKAVDAASGGSDVGIANLVVRDDALTTLAPVDGDYVQQRCNSVGATWVAVNGSVTVDGSGVTQPISAASLPLPTGAATSANQTTGNSSLSTIAGAVSGTEMQVDVVSALPAGTNNIGDVDIASAIPAGTNVIGDVGISGARTSGGTTLYKNIDVDESEDQVKATAGQVYWIHAINLGTAPRYLKIYNATAASVTVGTTTPDLTFPIPSQGDANGAGFTLSIANGIAFSTAITIAATTGVADNDSGAPDANSVIVNLGYA